MRVTSFADKFLRKIRKIDPEQVESFIGQVLREKAFFEVIFDSITEGLIVADSKSRVLFINEAARRLLGLMRAEWQGKPLGGLLKAPVLAAVAEEFARDLKPIRQREVALRTPERRIYLLTAVPIENEQGVMTHSVWVVNDHTEASKRMEERSHAENIESLATLTAGVAHEIKNPLNSLQIHTQLVQKAARDLEERVGADPASERVRKSTGVILEEIARLARIVDDFIRAVRPVDPHLRPGPVNRAVETVAELIGPECAERGIDLEVQLEPDNPVALIDPEQLHQALLNIAKNAMEAMDKPAKRLVLRSILKGDLAVIEVEDNGSGIPESERLRIFEPYHTTKFHGTGLGLTVVHRIVKAHRGVIGVSSDVGEGTTFSIALPVDARPVRMLRE